MRSQVIVLSFLFNGKLKTLQSSNTLLNAKFECGFVYYQFVYLFHHIEYNRTDKNCRYLRVNVRCGMSSLVDVMLA